MWQVSVFSLILFAQVAEVPAAKAPTSLDFDAIRSVVVQHDGRWPPLDTLARDLVEEVTGDSSWDGADPVGTLFSWTFAADSWMRQPLISIANAELRRELQLAADRALFSYEELLQHQPLRELMASLASIEQGKKMNPLQSKVNDLQGKLSVMQQIFSGSVIKVVPDANDSIAAWRVLPVGASATDSESDALMQKWGTLQETFLADDREGFAAASQEMREALHAAPAAFRPSAGQIDTELLYNQVAPFRTAWKVMIVGALLSAVALVARRRLVDVVATVGLVAGFAMVSYGLSLRWTIAGRVPASNMYESLLFLGWGMGGFAILAMFFLRYRAVPLTASAMGAVALVLADVLPIDHFVRPAPPVLMDTVWMSIHVPIIMVSYSVLALGVLFAHVQILGMAAAPGRKPFAQLIDTLHYWYIHIGSILLLAGVVTGSMWAASSWGRYWGWDPKEVWSLAALLGYLTILHVRIDRSHVPKWAYLLGGLMMVSLLVMVSIKLAPLTAGKSLALLGTSAAMVFFVVGRGPFATAAKSIICFWLIIMTYVGVNYVLGIGLHSYGFGTGAMARYMMLLGSTDLALVLLCAVVYLIRRRRVEFDSVDLGALSTVPAPTS